MAKTEDPIVKRMGDFEEILKSPKGFGQRSIKFTFHLLGFPLLLLSKIFTFPLGMGGDYGKIFHIQEKEGYRKAVEFGFSRLERYLENLRGGESFFKSLNEVKRQMTWMFLARTIDYAYWDPRPEDELAFNAITETLGTGTIGNSPSEAFCAMARFSWVLGKREEPWQWIERAIRADKDNAVAFYLKGWFEIQLDKGNPVESLFEAVIKDPDLLRKIRSDSAIAKFPKFIDAVDARARHAGIYVI